MVDRTIEGLPLDLLQQQRTGRIGEGTCQHRGPQDAPSDDNMMTGVREISFKRRIISIISKPLMPGMM